MLSLLQKYKQWLACFLAGLLCVVFSSVAFAKQPTDAISTQTQQQNVQADYYGFAATHLEPNFYN